MPRCESVDVGGVKEFQCPAKRHHYSVSTSINEVLKGSEVLRCSPARYRFRCTVAGVRGLQAPAAVRVDLTSKRRCIFSVDVFVIRILQLTYHVPHIGEEHHTNLVDIQASPPLDEPVSTLDGFQVAIGHEVLWAPKSTFVPPIRCPESPKFGTYIESTPK